MNDDIIKDNIYEKKNLNQLILLFGIPSILALIIEMLTGVTDTAFAGNLPDVGGNALSAMALITPILNVFTALQTLFAMSSGVLVAKYLNNEQKRKNSMAVGFFMSLFISGITSLICGIWLTSILKLTGADGEILELATVYMQVQLFSNVVSSMGYTMTCTIRALGFPKVEMIIVTIAVAANICFNGLLSFGFDMGIRGLAVGTFISEMICATMAAVFLIKKAQIHKIQKISISQGMALGKEMFKIGFAQTIIQILGGTTGFFVNAQLLNIGSTLSIAAWSIAQRVYMILLMPIVGLSQGVQTIIAYFNGQNQRDKVKSIASVTEKYCAIYGAFALILVILLGESMLGIFGGNQEILEVAQTILVVVFSCFPLVGIFYTNMTMLQVTGREISSVFLILARQVFLLIPLLYLMPTVFSTWGLPPVTGLFVANPIADCSAVLISIIIKRRSDRTRGK